MIWGPATEGNGKGAAAKANRGGSSKHSPARIRSKKVGFSPDDVRYSVLSGTSPLQRVLPIVLPERPFLADRSPCCGRFSPAVQTHTTVGGVRYRLTTPLLLHVLLHHALDRVSTLMIGATVQSRICDNLPGGDAFILASRLQYVPRRQYPSLAVYLGNFHIPSIPNSHRDGDIR